MEPGKISTVSAQNLLLMTFAAAIWLVECLIFIGLTLLVGSPKTGKSWMATDLALCVSSGKPFLGFPTAQADVLYISLEDTYARLQQRLFRLVDEANDRLRIATSSAGLHGGLITQLEDFIVTYPETRLVIIDTFQIIRDSTYDSVYQGDYRDVQLLKKFADEHSIAIVLVHHTRKMRDAANVFNEISGSNGIMGAADTTLILRKANYFEDAATLSVTGRDVDMAEYQLRLHNCRWEVVGETSRAELIERQIPAGVLRVLDFMSNRACDWEGTATQLIEEAGVDDLTPNVLAKRLNESSRYLEKNGLKYDFRRTSNARLIHLRKIHADAEGGSVEG